MRDLAVRPGSRDGGWSSARGTGSAEPARLSHGLPNVGAALLRAEESRRLNVRALGTPDAGTRPASGNGGLEHSSVAIRSLLGNLEVVARREAEQGLVIDPALRAALGTVLHELAEGLRSFGRLVREESAQWPAAPPDTEPVRSSLEELHEARARLADLLLAVDPRRDPAAAELVVALAQAVERLLRELDLDERGRRLPAAARRPRVALPRVGTVRRR